MTKKIIWRLANRPTPEEIVMLLKSGILSKEQAREILYYEQEEENSTNVQVGGTVGFTSIKTY